MADVVIRAERLQKSFVQGQEIVSVLRSVDLTVDAGHFIAITGASGSGKSTLLNILGLLDTADDGVLVINGHDTTRFSRREQAQFRLHHIGFIFQSYNLINNLTVFENIILPLKLLGDVPRKEIKLRATRLLEIVGLLEKRNAFPHELSGGEQQRVAIARAIVKQPAFVLADEPTANLDTHNGMLILDLLKKINRLMSATIVMITHDPNLAELADYVVALQDGVLTDYRPGGTPSQTTFAKVYTSESSELIVNLQRKLRLAHFVILAAIALCLAFVGIALYYTSDISRAFLVEIKTWIGKLLDLALTRT